MEPTAMVWQSARAPPRLSRPSRTAFCNTSASAQDSQVSMPASELPDISVSARPERRIGRRRSIFSHRARDSADLYSVADAARRMSPGALIGVPHLVDSYFIAVGYGMSRTVSACRGGSLTVAAAGGTSQATSATGLRQCGQAGPASRPAPGPARDATSVVGPGGRATSRVAALRLRRRRGLPWARCQRCLQRALQYFCRGAAGVQVNGAPQAGQSRCSALTGWSRRPRPCG